jgi:hypothetical protein
LKFVKPDQSDGSRLHRRGTRIVVAAMTYSLADVSNNGLDISKQVKDCCGGFQARGGAALFSTGGSTIVSSYTGFY